MVASRRSHPILSSPQLRDAVAKLVRVHGVRGAASMLGVARESVARILAQLPVRPGTNALIGIRLADLSEDAERTGGRS